VRLDHLLSKEIIISFLIFIIDPLPFFIFIGGIAQLARAVALQAIGLGFESPYLHIKAFFDKRSDYLK
jgi:hypothetical protein